MKHVYLSIILLLPLIGFSCQTQKQKTQFTGTKFESPELVRVPDIPSSITVSDERAVFLVNHYWDRFDFADYDLLQRSEITEQAFVDYINILNYVPNVISSQSLKNMLKNIESNKIAYTHFVELYEKYLYDPKSPFLNEKYYISVLEEVIDSPVLNESSKSRYQFQLDLAKKNRIGQIANDFIYTLSSGEEGTLHGINSRYIILMFIDPGCRTCAEVIDVLSSSVKIDNALAKNTFSHKELSILTIYPDTDLDEWRNSLPNMPSSWINAYDKELKITNDTIFDLKSIPTLYLLDKDKKVVLKDAKVEQIIDFF